MSDSGNGKSKIYLVGADGGTPRRLTSDDFDESFPSWSRDGKSIYFASDRGAGLQVWRSPIAGGAPVQISPKGGSRAAEAADGKTVYYARGASVWKTTTGAREAAPVVELGARTFWSVTGSGLFILEANPGSGPAIDFFGFATRARKRVLTLQGDSGPYFWRSGSFAVSPNGEWAVYEHGDREESRIMIADNFR